MKSYKIMILSSAKEDLAGIIDYLSSFYENTAANQYDRIIEKINRLKQFPFMYPEYESSISNYNYRKMVVDNYLVFYTVSEDTVRIHNIINGKMDIGNII